MTKDDIQVSFTDNILTIKGEKKKEEEDEGKDYYRVRARLRHVYPHPAAARGNQSGKGQRHV